MKKFKKLAFLSDNEDSTLNTAGKDLAILGLGSAAGEIGQGISRAGWNFHNAATPQNSTIGELFADYAQDKLRHSSGNVLYVPSSIRTPDGSSLLAMMTSPVTAYVDSVPAGRKILPSELSSITEDLLKHLGAEYTGDVPPDKLTKLKLSGGVSSVDDLIKHLDMANLKHYVSVPRNNVPAMAHEFGHIAGMNELEPVSGQPVRNALKAMGRKAWAVLAESSGSSLPEIPIAEDVHRAAVSAIRGTSLPKPLSESLITMLFGSSLPVMGTAALANFETARNAAKAISPFDSVDNAIDWIGENPGTSVGVASIPFLTHEMFTSAPGGKLVYDFFNDLPDKAGILAKHPYTDDVLKAVGKVSPNKELLKFLTHNIGIVAGRAALPLGLIAANYLMNRNKES